MTKTLYIKEERNLEKIKQLGSSKAVFIELPIYKQDVLSPYNENLTNNKTTRSLNKLIELILLSIQDSSVIFIYGSPIQLIKFNELINNRLHFHYWISLDAGDSIEKETVDSLKHNHLGMLLYSKNKTINWLDIKNTRTPYFACMSCSNNVKDWGGKKHLMNTAGAGLSDVWKDLYKHKGFIKDKIVPGVKLEKINTHQSLFNNKLECPNKIKEKIEKLVGNEKIIHIKIEQSFIKPLNLYKKVNFKNIIIKKAEELNNQVILGDCIEEMKKLSKKYPNGIFDLVFADPPYNLAKKYKEYNDTKQAKEYEEWCNAWLELCVKLTKPTGSIFILNIPRWSLSHAATLNKFAYLRNWVVWDSLSTPKGKIMPAHYSLLYYTKEPTTKMPHQLEKIDPINYCLKPSCQKIRNSDPSYIKNKVYISDIWYDVHRIKHKKNRDDHPCQLPYKLMDRIIQMFSNKDDIIFDPFGGSGTTGICALKNNRNYSLMEIDPYYKEISEQKINEVIINGDTIRKSVNNKKRSKYTKKFLEIKAQELSQTLKRKPTIDEFIKHFNLDIKEIKKLYQDPKQLLKAGRISILNQKNS